MVKYYISLSISIICNCLSLILLKKGMLSVNNFGENLHDITAWFQLLVNGYIIFSIILFVLSFITWMISLTKIDLSLAYPTVSITYIIITLASYYFFNEALTIYRIVGIFFIITGIVIMY